MCYVRQSATTLPFETIRHLLDQLRTAGTRIEILGGEPLLREDIATIVAYAKHRCRSPFVSLYTNATHATLGTADALARAGLDAVLVTLISHTAPVHDSCTGTPGSWKRTIDGIRRFRDAGIRVYTHTAIHALNCMEYREIYNFVTNTLGVHALFYHYIPQRPDDPLMIDPVQWHKIKHWVVTEKNPAHARFVRGFCMLTGNACSGGNFVLTVKADGSVRPCPFISDIPLGSVYHDSLWDIFSRRYETVSMRQFKSLPDECATCSIASICGGGCRAGNKMLHGTYTARDIRCTGPFSSTPQRDNCMDSIPVFF
jgi:radical SAM protein with 4Fe4S-binding SPASM domain